MAESRDEQTASDDSFTHLRSIIVGPEQRELVALRAHVFDPAVQTREVGRILPDAIQLRARDPQLMRALAPSIEDAITASVRRDPQPLADALFPVIGPAIRKAVAHTFDAMIESVNRTIERTVSWDAMQWRLTAWRTGKPYAEVVLANTLDYRVEQVFLIDRKSGLILAHVARNPDAERDADQVSAMLTAITDFARDSFHVGRSDNLESLRVGDLAVSIVQGPQAILAGVVRGTIPLDVRGTFENALESVHRQFGPALHAYNGDSAGFAAARPILDACLVSQRRSASRRPSYRWWVAGIAVLLAAVGVWIFLDLRDRQSWNAYLDRLSREPGIVVLSSDRRGGKFFVSGLRDPLARDPASLLAPPLGPAPESIESRWEPYQALYPAFVTARAGLLLRPPEGVSLTFADGVLTATGPAPEGWISDSQRLAPAIPGVRSFVFAGESREAQLTKDIEGTAIQFAKGQSIVEPSQQPLLATLVARLEALDGLLASTGRYARLDVLGYADSDGPDDLNAELSQARANEVLAALRNAALQRIEVSSRGLGRAPITPDRTESQQEQDRRASFSVQVVEDSPFRSSRP